MDVRRIAAIKTAEDFQKTLERLGIAEDLAFDATVEHGDDAPLARPYQWRGGTIGNRFAILPMEGGGGGNRNQFGDPADGRVGRDRGRQADRVDTSSLGALRAQRRQDDLGGGG